MLAAHRALVTGSTSGIGLGIAKALASRGAKVVLNGFGSSGEIETLLRLFKDDYQVDADYSPADLSKVGDIEDLFRGPGRGVDILVNNAGIQHVSPVDKFPVDMWDKVIAINQSSVFHTTRLALPSMKAKNWGRIINIASVHGLVGSVEKSAYVASKHAVVGLTKVTALELARTGVTVNAICPGWVLTPLVQKQIDAKAAALHITNAEAQKVLLQEKQPSLQFATPAQLGELAGFMCSDAASEVRGVAWAMDGGWSAQ